MLFIIGFIWPLIVVKKSGSNPHGTHEGSAILTQFSSVSIFLWLVLIILYIFFNNLIETFWHLNFLSNDMIIITGMILISFGFLLEILGIVALGINFRIELPIDETELITTGIYRIMRNPIVFGVFLLVFGSFLIIPTIIVLLIAIFNIITFNSKAIDEEKFLLQRFGDDYKNYKNRVGRYLPFKIIKE
ncbi:MAG: methyltransferase family protein [Promethearchaeota archaeon]